MQTSASLKVFEKGDYEDLNERDLQILTKDYRSKRKTIRKQSRRVKREAKSEHDAQQVLKGSKRSKHIISPDNSIKLPEAGPDTAQAYHAPMPVN